jgi:uncharacterized membrane protein (DUF485 family)
MSRQATPAQAGDGEGFGSEDINWLAAEHSPEFRELRRRKRAFIIPALIFSFVWYFGFIALAGYAEEFMGRSVYQGFTVGYALALSQFLMVWVLGAMYLRKASREWEPLRQEAVARALMYFRRSAPAEPEERYGDSSPMGISRPGSARERDREREEVHR